jgi:hypothetical protein
MEEGPCAASCCKIAIALIDHRSKRVIASITLIEVQL